MAISFNDALGNHPLALALREQRADLLAANMANSETPDFKARDLDFGSILSSVQSESLPLAATQPQHLPIADGAASPALKYRTPSQPSLDGNTVDSEQEKVRFGENAMRYQASLSFLGNEFSGLMTAIKG